VLGKFEEGGRDGPLTNEEPMIGRRLASGEARNPFTFKFETQKKERRGGDSIGSVIRIQIWGGVQLFGGGKSLLVRRTFNKGRTCERGMGGLKGMSVGGIGTTVNGQG